MIKNPDLDKLMNLKNSIFFLATLCLLVAPLQKVAAQGASVKAFTNERKIVIGDQIRLFLEVKPDDKADKIQWAKIPDTIQGLEILEKGKIDTVTVDNKFALRQRLLVTGFDSGKFYIPSFGFQINSNGQLTQYATDSILVDIQTVAVDTAKAFKPIKEIVAVKFSIWEYWKEMLAGLALIGLILFVIIYFVRNKGTKMPEKTTKVPPEKAHEKGLRLLRELQAKEYMQHGKSKEYFTELSDILRIYLEERFDIAAMEQTTDELLSLLKKQTDNKAELRKVRPEMKLILRTADLAKFAKANPLPDEFEACYRAALEVINRTQFKQEEAGQ